jgi:hypothetical protein
VTVDVAPHVKGRGGRPSHKETIIKEYERRKREGLCEDTTRSESFYLESWFKKNFRTKIRPDHKTITAICPVLRKRKAKKTRI